MARAATGRGAPFSYKCFNKYTSLHHMVSVVQMDRTPDCDSGGREFKPPRPPQSVQVCSTYDNIAKCMAAMEPLRLTYSPKEDRNERKCKNDLSYQNERPEGRCQSQ